MHAVYVAYVTESINFLVDYYNNVTQAVSGYKIYILSSKHKKIPKIII